MKQIIRSSGVWLAAGLLALAARGQAPEGTALVRPIESLWLTTPQPFPNTSERDAALAKALKEWRQVKVFDAVMLLRLPPTFSDETNATGKINALIGDVGGHFGLATIPVGKEGWESSNNQRLAQKNGGHYDSSKAVTQLEWLATFQDTDADMWTWALEQPARMPTPEQAARSASEFVKYAKAQHKKAAIWLSGEGFGMPAYKAMTQSICEATRNDADYFGWMDLPGASLRAGEDKWRETLGGLLDQILALTPKEKIVIQWAHNPKWPAKDAAGTKAYISTCQAKGINRFCVLSMPAFLLNQPQWTEFYKTLPKAH